MAWAYTTVEQMKNILSLRPDSAEEPLLQEARLLAIIEGVAQVIDRWTERSFRVYEGAMTFTPEFDDFMLLPDLLSVTSALLDYDQDRTREITLSAASDYLLEPLNAPQNERPYTRLRMRRDSYYFLPRFEAALSITGKWGYWERLRDTETTLAAALTDAATTLTVADSESIQVGWTLRIDSEQVYVRRKDAVTGVLTVSRGQNGTSAAAHDADASIDYYVYPEALETAAMLQAARIYRRSETPLGIVNNPGDIGWRSVYIPKIDLDVQELLRVFRKRNIL